MKPCDNCKRNPCPAICYPLKDWERGQKQRGRLSYKNSEDEMIVVWDKASRHWAVDDNGDSKIIPSIKPECSDGQQYVMVFADGSIRAGVVLLSTELARTPMEM